MQSSSLKNSQNFFKSSSLVAALLGIAQFTRNDTVYEIGAGKGIITEQLALTCRQVIGIEKDRKLAERLAQKFSSVPNVLIRHGDFLVYPLPRTSFKVISNLPFDQTAEMMKKLTATESGMTEAYLVMQKEAADRFIGNGVETMRSVLLKPWFDLRICYSFLRTDFTPMPSVDSVFLSVKKRRQPEIAVQERGLFRDFIVYCFSSTKPDLAATLETVLSWRQVKSLMGERVIRADSIPSSVSYDQWLKIFRVFKESGDGSRRGDENHRIRVVGAEKRLEKRNDHLQKVHRTRTCRNSGR